MLATDTLAPGERHTARVVLITAVAALGGFLFGFDTALINGAVDAIRAGFGLDATATGFAVSCALLGSAIGAWYAGALADRFGRVRTMVVAAVLLAASAVGTGLAPSVAMLVVWRLVGGLDVGDRTGVHRRSLAGAGARSPRFAAAAGDRPGRLRRAAV